MIYLHVFILMVTTNNLIRFVKLSQRNKQLQTKNVCGTVLVFFYSLIVQIKKKKHEHVITDEKCSFFVF